MHHKFLRLITVVFSFVVLAAVRLSAQPCADNQPVITGAQVVRNGQDLVIYSTPNIPGHTYLWSVTGGTFASGNTSNQVTVTWGGVGSGNLTLTETNPASNCSTTVSKTIAVQPLLVSYFFYTNTSCYGDELTFHDMSVADPAMPIDSTTGYKWTFGDGGTSTAKNPTHTYGMPYNQTYTVMLVVTNSIGYTDTIYDAVYVNPNQFIPAANFSAAIPSCSYDPVNFTSTSTTPVGSGPFHRYSWNFGDPASGASNIVVYNGIPPNPNVSHLFSGPGTYTVTLEVLNDKSCTNIITRQIFIDQTVPTSSYTFSSPTCEFNAVYFTDNSTSFPGKDITSWEWNFGDGTAPVTIIAPASPNTQYTYPGLGPYHCQLKVTNNLGCVDSSSRVITLDPSPKSAFSQNSQCYGDTVQFSDLSIANGGPPIASYYWNFGDLASGSFNSSTLQNPTHKFSAPGTYGIMMVTTNTSGCPDTLRRNIEIHDSPIVNFNTTPGTQNNEVHFHAQADFSIIGNMMTWNFGDGEFGYGHDPVHVYPTAGSYDVILTVTDTLGCTGTVTHTILVPSVPVAFFSSTSPACLGQTICFHDLSSVPTPPFGFIKTWIWDFGDGTPADTVLFPNDPDLCHVYSTIDTFTVVLNVIDDYGYTDTYTANVYTIPIPSANFHQTTACQDMIVSFFDASSANGGGNIISYDWNFGDPGSGIDNTSAQLNPTHIFAHGDSCYNVRLIVINFNNCTDTITKQVCVFPKPPLDFVFDTACLNQLVHFDANSGITYPDSIVSWSWNFGDGTPLGTDAITTSHLYTTTGVFTVTLSVTDHHGCTSDTSHTVRVNPLPVAEFTWASPNCQGVPVQFTDHSYLPAGFVGYVAKWKWEFGDGSDTTITIPGSPNIAHTFLGNAICHDVKLTVWTGDSCFATITQQVCSLPAPIAGFQVAPVTCKSQPVQFNDQSQPNGGGSITTWLWNFDDPPSGTDNTSPLPSPVHTFTNGNTWYNVRLIVTNGNTCRDTIVIPVYIRALPDVDFAFDTACLNMLVHYNGNSGITQVDSIVSWVWTFGDGSPAVNDPVTSSHLYGTTGTFTTTLTVTDNHGCINTISHDVTVNPLPEANFIWNSPNCEGAPIQFINQSTIPSGYLTTWIWNFGDTTPPDTIHMPNPPNIIHTFAGTSLVHQVSLTVISNFGCPFTITKTVTSIPKPIAAFHYSTASCMDQTVQFNDDSQPNGGGTVTGWDWYFDDPISGGYNTSTLQNPTHVFGSQGDYNVRLIVTNASGCRDTITDSVHILQLPVAKFAADTACFGTPTQFTDLSIAHAGGIAIYSWDFGDGMPFGNLPNPAHLYGTTGVFNVTLTITNTNGCIKDTTIQVLVNPKPLPGFTFTTPNCVGAVVCFTNTSQTPTGYLGSIKRWHWEFGDGADQWINYPANPDICHTFLGTAQNHTVRLTVVTSDSCQDFIEHVIASIPAPIANFNTPDQNCEQQQVHFTDQSQAGGGGNIIGWDWDFGDPASGTENHSTAQSPTHNFTSATLSPFTVTLIVTNASNCTDTITKQVSVSAKPVASFSADTACLGHLTTFTALTATNITQYNWTFGDGQNGTSANVTHMYGTAGLFPVTLTVITSEGCQKDTTMQIRVIPAPVAAFSFSAPTCAGTDSVHFFDQSQAPYGSIKQWDWDFGDGQTTVIHYPNDQNVYHTYTDGGTYTVTLTVHTSDSCTATILQTLTVEPAPLPNFIFVSMRCEDTPVAFTDQSQQNGGAALTAWLWDFGDPGSGTQNTSIVANPEHSFSTFGDFIVKLQVTNASGCHDTISKTVHVDQKPGASFTADTACSGQLTQFTDASVANGGSVTAWLWNFGDPPSGTNNTSTLQNPTHDFTSTGTFTVMLSATNTAGCTDDTIMQVIVNPKPQAMFEFSSACVLDSTHFTDLSLAPGSQVVSWAWSFGDGGSSTIQNPNHAFANSGTFTVTLAVTNLSNCVDSISIPVTVRPKPNAAYAFTNFFCPAGQVNFQDQSTGVGAAITERMWIFEPGSFSNQINPTHIFAQTNTTYAVSLIVTDNYGCTDTIVDSVFVKPGFAFHFANDTVCFKETTHFTPVNEADGDSLYSLTWNFGDPTSGQNNISHDYYATHSFTHPGDFVVQMKAYNSDNCVDSLIQIVTVHALPEPAFTYNTVPCDSNLYFTDHTTGFGSGTIASWDWDFGDGSPHVIIPAPGPGDTSHLYVNQGFYDVILKITNTSGCSDTVSMRVQRIPCIKAAFVWDTNMLCARYPVAFSDSSLPVSRINSWRWIWGDGTPDTNYTVHATGLTHTYASGGTYPVKLIIDATVSGTPVVDSITQNIVIHPTPQTYFSNPAACLNQINLFADTSETFGAQITSWKWNFGAPYSPLNDTSSLRNPPHTYDSAGWYDVKLVLTNKFGCKDSLTKPTRVWAIPEAKFSNSVACSGNPTTFEDISIIGDTAIGYWHWNFGDISTKKDTSLVQDPVYYYKNTGDYYVNLIVGDRNGCRDTIIDTVTVYTTPVSIFTLTDTYNGMTGKVLLNNKSEGASSYYWDFGNGVTSTDENPIVTYSQDGTYIIKLVSTNDENCTDSSYYKYEVLFRGLYIPNAFSPSNTNVAVRLFKPVGINLKQYHIQVFDNWGHMVWESTKLDSQGKPEEGWDGTFNGTLMQQGVYMWKASAIFIDDSIWEGSDIGQGDFKTIGTVTLIR